MGTARSRVMTEIGSSQWRCDMRADLIARRQEIPVAQRNKADAKLAHMLGDYIGDVSGKVVSIYWPFRGEPDLRAFAKACRKKKKKKKMMVDVIGVKRKIRKEGKKLKSQKKRER